MKTDNFVSLYEKRYVIGTHDGPFTPCDVLACAIISIALSENYAIEIIRTRDLSTLQEADILITNVSFKSGKPKTYHTLDSVWNEFSKEVYKKLKINSTYNFEYTPSTAAFPFITSFIPPWNLVSRCGYDKCFVEAVQATALVLKNSILQNFSFYEAAEDINYRLSCNGSFPHEVAYFTNGILQIENGNQPWLETVLKYNCNAAKNFVNFVIYPNLKGGWTAECVPISSNDNQPRFPFPDKLAESKSKDLPEITGIKEIISCSYSGDVATAETKDAIYSLCLKVTLGLIK